MFGSLPRGRSFITRKASVGSTHWWTGLTNWGSRKLSSSTTISAVPDQAWWKDPAFSGWWEKYAQARWVLSFASKLQGLRGTAVIGTI
jgi:hypothetical protein